MIEIIKHLGNYCFNDSVKLKININIHSKGKTLTPFVCIGKIGIVPILTKLYKFKKIFFR